MSKKSRPGDGSHGKGKKKSGGSEELLSAMFSPSPMKSLMSNLMRMFR